MFQSLTERKAADRDALLPGPQDYAITSKHLNRKDFSRPILVMARPTRNTDGAFRTNPNIASDELRHKNISPGPVPSLELPTKERDRAEPRMRQYGLNMITNTL